MNYLHSVAGSVCNKQCTLWSREPVGWCLFLSTVQCEGLATSPLFPEHEQRPVLLFASPRETPCSLMLSPEVTAMFRWEEESHWRGRRCPTSSPALAEAGSWVQRTSVVLLASTLQRQGCWVEWSQIAAWWFSDISFHFQWGRCLWFLLGLAYGFCIGLLNAWKWLTHVLGSLRR